MLNLSTSLFLSALSLQSVFLFHLVLNACMCLWGFVCFFLEDPAPGASSQYMSISVVVLGALAKEFSETVNQGVGPLCHM